jgi:hypothetical protein
LDNLVTVTVTYACEATPSDCKTTGQTTGAVISCHNTAECKGGFCCGQYAGRLYTVVACSPTCDPDGDGGLDSHVRFCDTKNGNSECPPGETCAESTLLSGFFRCAAP